MSRPPFGTLPPPQPRFRRPVLSTARRKVARSILHMTFLLTWFAIMLFCTPAGSWMVQYFGEKDFFGTGAPVPHQPDRADFLRQARLAAKTGRMETAVKKFSQALTLPGHPSESEVLWEMGELAVETRHVGLLQAAVTREPRLALWLAERRTLKFAQAPTPERWEEFELLIAVDDQVRAEVKKSAKVAVGHLALDKKLRTKLQKFLKES